MFGLLQFTGSKQKLLDVIHTRLSTLPPDQTYIWIEPFAGSLVVPLHFIHDTRFKHFYVNDRNPFLFRFFKSLQQVEDIDDLIAQVLRPLVAEFLKDPNVKYYEYRKHVNENPSISSDLSENLIYISKFIIVNRTCFRGLSRYNRLGEFNVPLGTHKKRPNWEDVYTKMKEVHALLRLNRFTFFNSSYDVFLTHVSEVHKDSRLFFYCDPPYDDSFNQYVKEPFLQQDQRRLCQILSQHAAGEHFFIVHNSQTNFIMQLYQNYHQLTITTRRCLNTFYQEYSSSHGLMDELMISNLPIVSTQRYLTYQHPPPPSEAGERHKGDSNSLVIIINVVSKG